MQKVQFVKNEHARYGVRVIYTSKGMSRKFGVRVIHRYALFTGKYGNSIINNMIKSTSFDLTSQRIFIKNILLE
jgi:hydroxylamine reductase (hybrid-cluster protein)